MTNGTTEEYKQDLLTFIKDELIVRKNLNMAIPSKIHDAERAAQIGSAMNSVPNVIRSNEWLHENGRCLDNIRPSKSTIPQAGRGAFATRDIQKDAIIAPAPMLHFERSDLHMYVKNNKTVENDDGTTSTFVNIDHVSEQIILNYSYGHPDSSLLLFPYSPITNFINHNEDKSKVNARLQWSTLTNHHDDWLSLSPEEVMSKTTAGLMMDFVAIRDIKEGEEIYIDYGHEWQDAWDDHVANLAAMDNEDNDGIDYFPIELLNSKQHVVKTEEEQMGNPYAKNVLVHCHIPGDFLKEANVEKEYIWFEYGALYRMDKNSRECTVQERYQSPDTNETLYRARIKVDESRSILVDSIPRRAIEFLDRPYTSDQHLTNAFRHEIVIPSNLMPEQWMDLRKR